MTKNKLAIIGGSGLYEIEGLESPKWKSITTPWGKPSDEILNCEYEGILGPVAGIVGNIQAIEVLKKILKIGDKSSNKILILDLIKLNFRRVKFFKKKNCICKKS